MANVSPLQAFALPTVMLDRLVAPVPPLPTASVPVTPGVIFAVPLKLAVAVEARFVRIVLAVTSFVAAAAVPPDANAPTSPADNVIFADSAFPLTVRPVGTAPTSPAAKVISADKGFPLTFRLDGTPPSPASVTFSPTFTVPYATYISSLSFFHPVLHCNRLRRNTFRSEADCSRYRLACWA